MPTLTGEKLAPLAEDIARHLGQDWTAEPFMNHAFTLRHPDGRGLFARTEYNSSRLLISGDYPTFERRPVRPRSEVRDRITVDSLRGGEAIAKDITRRLLPGYTLALAEVHEQIAALTVAANGVQATAERLAKQLGVQPLERHGELVLYPPSPLYALKVTGPDSVRVEAFTCTADQATALIKLLT